DLTDAHFLRAVGGAGGAKVHEIDTGDQEDKHGDDGEDVYELNIAVDIELTRLIGMEVHVGEGGDGAPEVISRFLEGGARSTEHCLKGRTNMEADYFVYILLNFGSR